jgi:hypothetical protein
LLPNRLLQHITTTAAAAAATTASAASTTATSIVHHHLTLPSLPAIVLTPADSGLGDGTSRERRERRRCGARQHALSLAPRRRPHEQQLAVHVDTVVTPAPATPDRTSTSGRDDGWSKLRKATRVRRPRLLPWSVLRVVGRLCGCGWWFGIRCCRNR